METGFARIVTVLIFAVIWTSSATMPPADTQVQKEAERNQEKISCMIKANYTLSKAFHTSVKTKHGFPNSPVRTVSIVSNSAKAVKCYSQRTCPNSNLTWCFNLYHPTKSIEMCLDSSSELINMTEDAAILGLNEYFRVGENCDRFTRGPCIAISSTPYYFERGILTCTSQDDTCTAKSFSRIMVEVSDSRTKPLEISYLNSTMELVLGQQNVYHFRAEISSADYLLGSYFIGILGNGTFIETIPEQPFCSTCSQDSYSGLKSRRIRVYSFQTTIEHCPSNLLVFRYWLVIDNALETDALIQYVCNSSIQLTNPYDRMAYYTFNLDLVPVTPLIDLVLLELPSNISTLKHGPNVQWTCSVQAGVGDKLVWLYDDQQLPATNSHGKTEQDSLCPTVNKPEALNTPAVGEHSKNVSQFVRNYTATLTLCNVSSVHSGLYKCVVFRERGENRSVFLWSALLKFPVSTTDEISTLLPPATDSLHLSLPNIVVCVLISVILIVMVVVLLLVVVYLRTVKRRKVSKMRQPSKRVKLVTSSPVYAIENVLWSEKPHYVAAFDDSFEFPRSKLTFINQLGEGTFGIVLLAKAEGLKEFPERNFVAVKTSKESAKEHVKENLWEELQLMRRFTLHPNVLNLLGYCKETLTTPLYLILEFAEHGNLKNFLIECQDVLHKLNHTPHVYHHDGAHRSCSSCSNTPSYNPNPVESPFPSSTYPVSFKDRHEYKRLLSQRSRFDSGISTGTPVLDLLPTPSDMVFNVFPTFSSDAHPRPTAAHCDEKKELHSAYINFDPDVYTTPHLAHDYVNTKGLLYMEDVANFALQIARGLKHLKDLQVVHTDLAARNILIAEGFTLKISDFGMARDISEKEYYTKQGGKIPLKWLPPESLEKHLFTYQSDIWSYGVILWEIFSYGEQPYSDVKIGQTWDPFIKSLKEGQRLPQPNGCPDSFYQLMLQCWQLSPDDRPSASTLIEDICTTHSQVDNSQTTFVTDLDREVLAKYSLGAPVENMNHSCDMSNSQDPVAVSMAVMANSVNDCVNDAQYTAAETAMGDLEDKFQLHTETMCDAFCDGESCEPCTQDCAYTDCVSSMGGRSRPEYLNLTSQVESKCEC